MNMKLVIAICGLLTAGIANADPVNLDFQDGASIDYAGLNGWNTNGGTGPSVAGLDLFAGCGAETPCTVDQQFTAAAGDVLSGYAQFIAHDSLPNNDWSFVTIENMATLITTTLFSSDVQTVGDNGSSALTPWSTTIATVGNYSIQFGVANNGDNYMNSELQVSGLSYTPAVTAVPVPAAVWLFASGLIGLGATLRKKA